MGSEFITPRIVERLSMGSEFITPRIVERLSMGSEFITPRIVERLSMGSEFITPRIVERLSMGSEFIAPRIVVSRARCLVGMSVLHDHLHNDVQLYECTLCLKKFPHFVKPKVTIFIQVIS